MRVAELEEVLKAFKRLENGESMASYVRTKLDLTKSESLRHIDTDNLILAGHSFGGATVFTAVQHPAFAKVSHAIALDPWIEPVKQDRAENYSTPLLVINSEPFTVWTSHFQQLRKLAGRFTDSYLFTIAGSVHTAFSDINLLLPSWLNRRTNLNYDPSKVTSSVVAKSIAFLTGDKKHLEQADVTLSDGRFNSPIAAEAEIVKHRL